MGLSQDISTAVRIILTNGLDWQETIICGFLIAAAVLVLLIVVRGIVGIVTVIANAAREIFKITSDCLRDMFSGVKNISKSAISAASSGPSGGPPKN